MALLRSWQAFSAPTGAVGTTQTLTTTDPEAGDFQPKALLGFLSGITGSVDAAGQGPATPAIGIGISTSARRVVGSYHARGVDTMDANRQASEAAFLATMGSGGFNGLLDIDAILSTGVRLIVDDQLPAAVRAGMLALGGGDITDVAIVDITQPTAAGDQDITTVAFPPDLIIFIGAQNVDTANANDGGLIFGAATTQEAIVNAIWAGRAQNAAGTADTYVYSRLGDCIASLDNAGAVTTRARVVATLANGFRLTWDEADATQRKIYALCIKGGRYKIDDFLTLTDTLTDIVQTMGFPTKAGVVVSPCRAESVSDTPNDQMELSLGAFVTASSRGAHNAIDHDNVGFQESAVGVEHDAVYLNLNAITPTIQGIMDIKSLDANGHTFIMDDGDPAQSFGWTIGMGDALQAVSSSDVGAGAEDQVLSGAATVQGTDVATGVELPRAEAYVTFPGGGDAVAGVGADAQAAAASEFPSSTDLGAGADAVVQQLLALIAADAGLALEAANLSNATSLTPIVGEDAGAGAEGTTAFRQFTAPTVSRWSRPPSVGPVLQFRGGDGAGTDYVAMGDVWDFASLAPFEVEVWAWFSGIRTDYWPRIVSKEQLPEPSQESRNGWVLFHNKDDGRAIFSRLVAGIEVGAATIAAVPIRSWHHLRAVYTGAEVRLYLDGVIQATAADVRLLPGNVGQLTVGAVSLGAGSGAGYSNLYGYVDDLRIWNAVRSDADFQAQMSKKLLGTEAGLVGYWPMDEGDGALARDVTAYRNHGAINGAAWVKRPVPFSGAWGRSEGSTTWTRQ